MNVPSLNTSANAKKKRFSKCSGNFKKCNFKTTLIKMGQ